jgi:hypothetical protein
VVLAVAVEAKAETVEVLVQQVKVLMVAVVHQTVVHTVQAAVEVLVVMAAAETATEVETVA